jgi:DNA-binding GntR family transcriptional regulator
MIYPEFNLKIEQPISIREKIYQNFKNEILNDRIPTSATLVENQLSKQMGISRTPIREALHFLEKEGLVELIPRVGYRVRQIDREELQEICEIRISLETLAARRAIKRMSPDDSQAIMENLKNSDKMIQSGKLPSFINLDAEFHELLGRASGSQRLLNLILAHRSDMVRYRIISLLRTDYATISLAGHRRIFECLVEKNESGVKSATKDHIDQAKKYIMLSSSEDNSNKESYTDNVS